MEFTNIPADTFSNLQLNTGVLLKNFDTSTGTLTRSDIICATTGGITVTATPTYVDLGDDVDNAPKNVKELKLLDTWECSVAFTCLAVSTDTLKLALGAASVSSNTVSLKNDLATTDFTDTIWWVGDLADGGYVAVELSNVLSTAGVTLKTSDKGKGTIDVTLTAHYALTDINEVPMSFYVS